MVCCQNNYERDIVTRSMDVICLNRYYGWYNLSGDLDAACDALNTELDFWAAQDKPVMFTEYGADTYPGVHNTNGEMFSEEYQLDYYVRLNAELDKRPFFNRGADVELRRLRHHPGPYAGGRQQKGPTNQRSQAQVGGTLLPTSVEQYSGFRVQKLTNSK